MVSFDPHSFMAVSFHCYGFYYDPAIAFTADTGFAAIHTVSGHQDSYSINMNPEGSTSDSQSSGLTFLYDVTLS